jgi:hypothetical protein
MRLASWSWENEEFGVDRDASLEFHTMEFEAERGGVPVRIVGTPTPSPTALAPELATPTPAVSPLQQPEFISPPSNVEEYLDADAHDIESRYRTMNSILDATSPPGFTTRHVTAELHMQIVEKPTTLSEAERHQPWR